jgi:hypothetical protein
MRAAAAQSRRPGQALRRRKNMNARLAAKTSFVYAMLLVVFCATASKSKASESDPWTYAYIPLADSAPLVSEQLAVALESVLDAVNASAAGERLEVDDRAVEFVFFAEFRRRNIRDVTWGLFERCIGTNSCAGWPRFERIQMYPEESVYHAAGWRFIPSRFHLAAIVEICGVRMGADKLTHFLDDGFHYFNALRSRRKNLDPEDIRRLSMAFERSYMGTRMTGILSRADIEANLAGVRFYGDIFGGKSPMIGRGLDGRLVLLRKPDICDYVTPQYDERILPNEFVYSAIETDRAESRSRALLDVIEAREQHAARQARELDASDLALIRSALLSRRIPMTHWQSDFPKMRLLTYGLGMVGQWLIDADFRQASSIFGFDPLKPGKLDDRKPVRIKRVELAFADE